MAGQRFGSALPVQDRWIHQHGLRNPSTLKNTFEMSIFDWFGQRIFNTVHRNNLVYNTCWEDPRLDRVALQNGPEDNILVITSAGCNALDYTLTAPNHVYAVDMNPRQNALLDLKIAAIRKLEYDDFFKMFGQGHLPGIRTIYQQELRSDLPDWSQTFWDKRIKWFDNRRRSFYFRGSSGSVARIFKVYTDKVIRIRPALDELLEADSVEQQREIYQHKIKKKFWSGLVKFTVNRDTTMSLLGVPKAQRKQIETQYPGGLVQFVQDCLESVFVKLPIKDNYFWRVYMNGEYTRECCPEYLKEANFELFRGGLIDRLSTHTDSVQGFLEKHDGSISRYVLLDHMDWLSDHFFPLLESEWQAVIDRAAPETRLIWRSGGLRTDFIDQVQVTHQGQQKNIHSLLKLDTDLAKELHGKDRVHTYGSFYIAHLSA